MQAQQKILRGQLIGFGLETISHESDGCIVIGPEGRIIWKGSYAVRPEHLPNDAVDNYKDCLILPGFVDAHIHFPQHRMLAAPAKDLLEWLNRFTFPEEARYGDKVHADLAAEMFLSRLFANGTTSASAFCSVHKQCADSLFAAAEKYNMALVTGKTMMDRNAIPAVQDTPEQGARESSALYGAWHDKGRLRYAVSPRFAVTSTEAQLAISVELLKSMPGALMQTHLSESAGEIALVKHLFPNAKDYTDVYDHYGLLSERSLFAHGIHLSERECARLSESASTVVHCPTSNAFLGSGIMQMPYMQDSKRPVHLGVATDIGGGTSYSMLTTLAETYKLQMLGGYKPSVHELFHLATLGNAKRLKIDAETGSLDVGKYADIVVLDPCATPVLKNRHDLSQSVEDMLFSLMMLGDDRAIQANPWISPSHTILRSIDAQQAQSLSNWKAASRGRLRLADKLPSHSWQCPHPFQTQRPWVPHEYPDNWGSTHDTWHIVPAPSGIHLQTPPCS
jgi:guanine deaminase